MNRCIQPITDPKGFVENNRSRKISGFDRKPEFEIHSFQSIEYNRLFEKNVAHQLERFEIIWITKGTGLLSVDLQKYHINKNVIFCLSPGQIRSLGIDCALEGYYISLSREFLFVSENQSDFSFLDSGVFGDGLPAMYPSEEMQEELGDILKKVCREFDHHKLLRSKILKGLLKIFLIYLSELTEGKVTGGVQFNDTGMVRKFLSLVRKNFYTKKMVADYAQELCVSANYLNRVVKKISGFTASYHIQQSIILEAKRQAIYSGLSMKEVAYSLGFEDYAHFSKFFKNNSGMNFTSFRSAV